MTATLDLILCVNGSIAIFTFVQRSSYGQCQKFAYLIGDLGIVQNCNFRINFYNFFFSFAKSFQCVSDFTFVIVVR